MIVRRLAAHTDCKTLRLCLPSSPGLCRPPSCTRPRAHPQRRFLFIRALSSSSSNTGAGALAHRQNGVQWAGSQKAGSIEIIIGPMFAGKTSALLQRIGEYEGEHANILAVKSAKDTRYRASHINTHDGRTRECYAVEELLHIKREYPEPYQEAHVIAIDEAQFFPDLREFCTKAANEDHKQVIVVGLNGDFRREKFGQILDLIPQADQVTKLGAECSYCRAAGHPRAAHFTLRIAADSRQEVVGGADKYAPVCRQHYNELSGIREMTAAASV